MNRVNCFIFSFCYFMLFFFSLGFLSFFFFLFFFFFLIVHNFLFFLFLSFYFILLYFYFYFFLLLLFWFLFFFPSLWNRALLYLTSVGKAKHDRKVIAIMVVANVAFLTTAIVLFSLLITKELQPGNTARMLALTVATFSLFIAIVFAILGSLILREFRKLQTEGNSRMIQKVW